MNVKRIIATLYLSAFCLLPSSPGIQHVVYAQPNHTVAIDAFGDIHVAGVFVRSITLGDTTLSASEGEQGTAFIARFDADGTLLSVRHFGAGTLSPEGIVALVTDDAGRGYIGGVLPDSVQLEPGLWSRGQYVASYDRDGRFQWVNTNLRMLIMDLAIDKRDQVHMVGLDSWEPFGYVAAKLDTAGDFIWHKEKTLGRGSLGVALALGVDDQTMLTGLIDEDVFATRLDQDGDEVWLYPFRGSAMIQYKLREAAFVDIRVYDVLGRNVAVLAQQRQHAGEHRIVFKTTELVSGTYFLHLRAGTHVQTRSITLLR